MLRRVNMTTLHLGRMKNIAIETYTCLNSISPEYIRDLVKYESSTYNFRYENMAELPTVRTTKYGKNSFRFESARVWNSLPNEMRKTENFKEFKRLARTWTGPGCKCSMCLVVCFMLWLSCFACVCFICFVLFCFSLHCFTLQEGCCRSQALRVTLQRESEIACICAGGFVYFIVNKMSYFSVSGSGPLLSFACTHASYCIRQVEISYPISLFSNPID